MREQTATILTVNQWETDLSPAHRDIAASTMPTNQIPTEIVIIRFAVTISWYLRWKKIAMYLSRLIAVSVKRDTPQKQWAAKRSETALLQKRFASLLILAMLYTRNIGWTTIPTPKSEKARPTSRIFDGVCKDGVLQIEMSTKRFPNVAVREDGIVRMQFITWIVGFSSILNESPGMLQQHSKSIPVLGPSLSFPGFITTLLMVKRLLFTLQ